MAKVKTVEERNKELALVGKKLKIYGIKLRAVPIPKQFKQINKTIGSSRFAFNFYLSERQETYELTGENLSAFDFKKHFNAMKSHPMFVWLREVDKFSLENAIFDVEKAYKNFFSGKSGFPKFKKKHEANQSYTTNFTNGNIKFDPVKKVIQLPKLGEVSIRMDKKMRKGFLAHGFNGTIKSATVSRHSSGQIHIALQVEEMIDINPKLNINDIKDEDISAYDLGLTHFMISSNGEKTSNPRYYVSSLEKLARMQRRLSKMVKGSNNYKKQQKKIAKLHLHIKNMRHDFLHRMSRKVVNENQVIILEDLNVKGMIKNRKLAKAIQDVGWGYFKQYVAYKAEWENKHVVFIDTFFPSSKLCNGCKEKNTMLSLSDRIWVCPSCGCMHDRDENAAKNIKEEGLRILLLKAAA